MINNLLAHYNRLLTPIIRWRRWPLVLAAVSIFLLTCATLYGAKQANFQQYSNSDNIVYPYLFQDFKSNDIVLPARHSNLVKFPLFILQSLLPYNHTTLALVNIGLVALTIGLWAWLLVRFFGSKYLSLICLSLASILFASPMLQGDLLGNTIRNIEYPIALAYIFLIFKIIRQDLRTRLDILIAIIVIMLMAATIAGDNLIIYIALVPILVVISIHWLQSRTFAAPIARAISVTVATVLISAALKATLSALGIIKFHLDVALMPRSIPLDTLGFSTANALTQTINLQGANIFGINSLSTHYSVVFLNFALLIVGLVGFCTTIKHSFLEHLKPNAIKLSFIGPVLAWSFFTTFAIYIFADQVAHITSTGAIISDFQDRYLSILPLLSVAGFILFIQRYYANHRSLLIILPLLFIGTQLISAHYIRATLTASDTPRANVNAVLTDVVKAANKEHVSHLLTGYWYGASVRLASNGKLQYVSVAGCNKAEPKFNTRISWYKADPSVRKSALLVDRSGSDMNYWGCTDSQIRSIYGQPVKIILLNGVDINDNRVKNSLSLWVYNYDVRSKLDTTGLGS